MHVRCNSTYRLRYWNIHASIVALYLRTKGCNSTYRLRYWNLIPSSDTPRSNCCNSTYRLRYWNALIATASEVIISPLQQYLPFTVLKQFYFALNYPRKISLQQYLPFTVLKLFRLIVPCKQESRCNSTYRLRYWNIIFNLVWNIDIWVVATVLTVYGIETAHERIQTATTPSSLQQYLPFTVLKLQRKS